MLHRKVLYRASFRHKVHTVAEVCLRLAGKERLSVLVKRPFPKHSSRSMPVSVYISRRKSAHTSGSIVSLSVRNGIACDVPSGVDEKLLALFPFPPASRESHLVRGAALKMRVAAIVIQRIGVVGIVKQIEQLGIGSMHAVGDMAIVESPREGGEEEQLVASRMSVQGVSAVGQALDASVDCGGKSYMLVGQLPTQPNCAARTECAVQGVVTAVVGVRGIQCLQ